jgi:hypothetical protein
VSIIFVSFPQVLSSDTLKSSNEYDLLFGRWYYASGDLSNAKDRHVACFSNNISNTVTVN